MLFQVESDLQELLMCSHEGLTLCEIIPDKPNYPLYQYVQDSKAYDIAVYDNSGVLKCKERAVKFTINAFVPKPDECGNSIKELTQQAKQIIDSQARFLESLVNLLVNKLGYKHVNNNNIATWRYYLAGAGADDCLAVSIETTLKKEISLNDCCEDEYIEISKIKRNQKKWTDGLIL